MKRYPLCRGSGIEWIGEIPEHWETKKVKYLCRIVNGATPKSGVREYWDGDIVWLTPEDLGELVGRRIYGSARRITEEGLNSCGTTIAPPYSIVLSTRAPIGHIGISSVPSCTNQGCKTIIPNPRVCNDSYAYYSLYCSKDVLQSLGQGSTFAELSGQKLRDFKIPYPPLPEQRGIAEYLDQKTQQIDTFIEKKQRLIELLNEQRTAIINQTVTIGLDPNVKMKDSGIEWLGEIPEHWGRKKAKHVSHTFVPQRNKPALNQEDDGYPWITMEDMTSTKLSQSKKGYSVSEQEAHRTGSRVLAQGSVVASCVGIFGVASVCEYPVIINQQLQAYIPYAIDPWFLRYLVSISGGYFEKVATTTTIPYVNQESFGEMPVVTPPMEEQQAIVTYLDVAVRLIDSLIDNAEQVIKRLAEYRTTLISEVVTGKIDVRHEAA